MGLKVFITGTSGYLGSILASQLMEVPEIDSITGIDNTSQTPPFAEKYKFIQMDIRSPEMADAMAGHDFVIHTACIVHWPAKIPESVRDDINFNGTRNVAQAAIKNQVHGFLQASSVSVYDPGQVKGKENITEDYPLGKGDSQMYYWNTKSTVEKILLDMFASSKVVLTLFRLGTITGPRGIAAMDDPQKNAIVFNGHDPKTQFIHEYDVVQAFAQAIHTDMPGAFNVVTDDFVRISDFYNILGVIPASYPLWVGRLGGFIRWRFFGSHIHPSWLLASLMDFAVSNAKLKATGWRPKYNSEAAIRSMLKTQEEINTSLS